MNNEPLVSIGLPVDNGKRYLEQALESILNQTYGNFELIITDNASVDGTYQICESFSRKDQRIRLSRNERNLGDAALLFDGQDVNGMSAVMHQVLTDGSLKMRLQKDGLKRSAQFSWEKYARETMDVYKTAVG